MSNKSISEIASECGFDPDKLLAVIQESHPTAKLHNLIEPDALDEAFCRYEVAHGIKCGPAQSNPSDPVLARAGILQPSKENIMTEDFFDETAVTAKAEQEWANDPNLRAEFGNDKEAWVAYTKANAEGLVKILGARNV